MNEDDHRAEVRRWLRHAHEDLAVARAISAGDLGAPRHACWLAQQAGEKALKALLVLLQIEFPKTHDLDLLHTLLPSDLRNDAVSDDLAELTQWAVEARYPGDWPEAALSDAQRAVATAQRVLAHADERLLSHGFTGEHSSNSSVN